MSLTKDEKLSLIEEYGKSQSNTGSPDVQIALLTKRIVYLTEHFKANKKDYHSMRGLLKLVSRRRRLLSYLKSRDFDRYKSTIQSLGIRA